MSGKKNPSKKNSQQLIRNKKRKIGDEEIESEKEVGNTVNRRKHKKRLSSQGRTKHTNFTARKKKSWQPLSKTSREYLQAMIDKTIMTILSKTLRENEHVHYHLNSLKKRLVQLCETLEVPPTKLKDLTDVPRLLKMEMAQHRANKESLTLLQEDVDKLEETTESMTENIESLKNKIQVLTAEVEKKEKKLKQRFLMDHSEVLNLPELSQDSLKAPILQDETLMLIPNQNDLLEDLQTLHNSSEMKKMLTFIEEAYNKLDIS
ncbi:PREDICTED: centromere protein Q [Elephantulus edwardii]|uniref:centromere protein Q n=1 Tax=Elephantulus edwardii TaxID=28737 RepID=UPI0003F0BE14|nr:PREDICTED: centromere protein Q [Elephantulus edwardii]